jgi:hypothetical protein
MVDSTCRYQLCGGESYEMETATDPKRARNHCGRSNRSVVLFRESNEQGKGCALMGRALGVEGDLKVHGWEMEGR